MVAVFSLMPVDFAISGAVRLSCMTTSQQSMALDVNIGECADDLEAVLVLGQSAIADMGEAYPSGVGRLTRFAEIG